MFATTPPPCLLPLTFPLFSCLDYSTRWYNYRVTMCLQTNIITFACCLPSYWIVVVIPKLTPWKWFLCPIAYVIFVMQSITLASLTIVVDQATTNLILARCTTYYSFFDSQTICCFSSLFFFLIFLHCFSIFFHNCFYLWFSFVISLSIQ
jgi:hypothetical protein